MVLDPDNPLVVQSLSVLFDSDALGYDNPNAIHHLDNIETTANSILIQEDPGGHNQGPVNGYAKIWRFPLPAGPPVKVAQVNQSLRPDLADRLVGVERDHRRVVRLRAGLVPRGHPGARLRDRDGAEPVPGHHVHA